MSNHDLEPNLCGKDPKAPTEGKQSTPSDFIGDFIVTLDQQKQSYPDLISPSISDSSTHFHILPVTVMLVCWSIAHLGAFAGALKQPRGEACAIEGHRVFGIRARWRGAGGERQSIELLLQR